MEIVYRAKDGKEFQDKTECETHEYELSVPVPGTTYEKGAFTSLLSGFPEGTRFRVTQLDQVLGFCDQRPIVCGFTVRVL